jgi:dolichol-phosphate mannosyltransferase
MIAIIKHFILFGGVGAINTIVSLVVILGLSKGFGVHYLLANIVGYAVGLALGFVLHKFITFRATANHSPAPRQFKLFLLVFAVAYAVQFIMLIILVDGLGWNDILAQIIACGVYTVIGFLGNRSFTFQKRQE